MARQTRKDQAAKKLAFSAKLGANKAKLCEIVTSASEALETYLAFAAKFHTYSITNTMLIYFSRPDATRVAGYRTWQALGRQVKKGEKGIAIIAPAPYKKKDAVTGNEESKMFFRTVYVFDVSQTEGDELPEAPEVTAENSAELAAALRKFVLAV